jgi:serine protease Do
VVADLIATGRVARSWIGVTWQETKSLADYFGAGERGVLVGSVVGDAPAARAGIQPGDVVVAWNGRPVSARFAEELPRFRKLIADTPIGSRVPLRILRRGAEISLDVVTTQQPAAESDESELASWGLTVRDITPQVARLRRIDDLEGALVTGVKGAAPAAVAGLQEGDVVRDVNGTRVRNTAELLRLLGEFDQAERDRAALRFTRGATKRMAVLVIAR